MGSRSSANKVEFVRMLKKLIFTGVFFGPFILAGVLYLSIDSDADRCDEYFAQMTTGIAQANFCAVDGDCSNVELDHPSYHCNDALVNAEEVDTIALINKAVAQNGCRLYLSTAQCEIQADNSMIARCVAKQCTWSRDSVE
jgi:hypothetical protein